MNPFTRRDALAETAEKNLNKIRNATLRELVQESKHFSGHRSALDHNQSLFYIEKPENLHLVNSFIKRFLNGDHASPMDAINRLNLQLNTIGLSIQNYDGESGTYQVYQYGNGPSDNPLTGDYVVDDELFLRSKVHAQIKIRKIAVPGGLFSLDGEIYITQKP